MVVCSASPCTAQVPKKVTGTQPEQARPGPNQVLSQLRELFSIPLVFNDPVYGRIEVPWLYEVVVNRCVSKPKMIKNRTKLILVLVEAVHPD